MLIPPRIIAIDDNVSHLHALARGLNETGAACITFPFVDGDIKVEHALRGIRAVFIDLHLAQSAPSTEETPNFAVIATLLTEHLDPLNGPFALFLWTEYSEHCPALMAFLQERAALHAIPVAALALKKADFLDAGGNFINANIFCREVTKLISAQPQVAALINWESRIAGAASDTIATLSGLIPRADRTGPGLKSELERLLSVLAIESVGASHVGSDRLAAVNEALLPILYDRMAQIRSNRFEQKLWKRAITSPGQPARLSTSEAARLNTLLHWDFDVSSIDPGGRGTVVLLPAGSSTEEGFRSRFGLSPADAARRQFGISSLTEGCRWVLVQIQAVCDHAQAQAGPLPYVLGMEFPADTQRDAEKLPDAIWDSPVFEKTNRPTLLSVNFRLGLSAVRQEVSTFEPVYRLREQLMNDLASKLHTYGARPGFTSFREYKKANKSFEKKESGPDMVTDQSPPSAVPAEPNKNGESTKSATDEGASAGHDHAITKPEDSSTETPNAAPSTPPADPVSAGTIVKANSAATVPEHLPNNREAPKLGDSN